jgi:electron transfer flavoprotein alpha subunit
MACILTFIEQRDGSIRRASLEALSEARRQGASAGLQVCAVLVGHGVAGKAAELGKHGAATVYVADDARSPTTRPRRRRQAAVSAPAGCSSLVPRWVATCRDGWRRVWVSAAWPT